MIDILPGVLLSEYRTSGEHLGSPRRQVPPARGKKEEPVPTERVAIFIDAAYLENVLQKEFPGFAVDFGKLAEVLAGGRSLLRTYFYNCPPYQGSPPTREEAERKAKADAFYAALKKLPRFEVRLGRLAKRSCRNCGAVFFQQKRADLMLGVDLVNLSARNQITEAIIVAGDSDFLPAVDVAKTCGVLIHLFHGDSRNPPHKDLFDACDERTLLAQDLLERCRKNR